MRGKGVDIMCHVPSGTATPMLGSMTNYPGVPSAQRVVKHILKDLGREELSAGLIDHDAQHYYFSFMEAVMPRVNDFYMYYLHDLIGKNSGS